MTDESFFYTKYNESRWTLKFVHYFLFWNVVKLPELNTILRVPFERDHLPVITFLFFLIYRKHCIISYVVIFFLRKKYTQKIQRSKISSMILLLFFIFQGTISSFYDHVIWTKITIKQKNGRYELNDASVANSKSCRLLQFWRFDDYLTKVRQMKVYAFSLFKTVYLSFFLLWL